MATSPRLRRLSALRRRRDGSVALEFALVAPIFFFMLFMVLEVAFVFVLDSVVSNAASESARLVRTGQAAAQGFDAAAFKARMCDRMSIFAGDCDARLSIDVREIPRFANPDLPDPMEDGAFSESELTYQNGSARNIMVVRAWYRHTLFTPFMHQALSRLDGTKVVLTSTITFRNEPWE